MAVGKFDAYALAYARVREAYRPMQATYIFASEHNAPSDVVNCYTGARKSLENYKPRLHIHAASLVMS